MIETLDNRFSERDYLVGLGAPEFTSVYPTRVVASAGDAPESWTSD